MARPERQPTDYDRRRLVAELDRFEQEPPCGRVLLVGAGPGDPELLTLKAVRSLQSADVILYDNLVAPDVLDLARREAKRVSVGKIGHGPSVRQDDICELMVALAREGKTVVRLKGGDPCVFGRANEEITACCEAGIEVGIVPGITAAQGAAAALGLSLTDRASAQRLQFVTGHGRDGRLPRTLNWQAIADPAVTTVIYMPRRTLAEFTAKAVAAGLSPATPAIAMASATRTDQAEVAATIGALHEHLHRLPADAPVLVMVGEAVRSRLDASKPAVRPARRQPAVPAL